MRISKQISSLGLNECQISKESSTLNSLLFGEAGSELL